MRFLSFEANGQAGIGWVKDIHATDFVNLTLAAPELPRNLKDLICAKGGLAAADAAARKAPASAVQTISSVTMLPLIPNPGKIVCMGLNYADHAKEGGNARPEYPSFFLRGNSSMVGHNQAIVRPKASTQLDYEAELAVIIGKKARHLTADNALECIAGYSCFNDGSIRNYQRKSSQWTIGKNFDGTGPFGPCLVTPEECSRPSHPIAFKWQSHARRQYRCVFVECGRSLTHHHRVHDLGARRCHHHGNTCRCGLCTYSTSVDGAWRYL